MYEDGRIGLASALPQGETAKVLTHKAQELAEGKGETRMYRHDGRELKTEGFGSN